MNNLIATSLKSYKLKNIFFFSMIIMYSDYSVAGRVPSSLACEKIFNFSENLNIKIPNSNDGILKRFFNEILIEIQNTWTELESLNNNIKVQFFSFITSEELILVKNIQTERAKARSMGTDPAFFIAKEKIISTLRKIKIFNYMNSFDYERLAILLITQPYESTEIGTIQILYEHIKPVGLNVMDTIIVNTTKSKQLRISLQSLNEKRVSVEKILSEKELGPLLSNIQTRTELMAIKEQIMLNLFLDSKIDMELLKEVISLANAYQSSRDLNNGFDVISNEQQEILNKFSRLLSNNDYFKNKNIDLNFIRSKWSQATNLESALLLLTYHIEMDNTEINRNIITRLNQLGLINRTLRLIP